MTSTGYIAVMTEKDLDERSRQADRALARMNRNLKVHDMLTTLHGKFCSLFGFLRERAHT